MWNENEDNADDYKESNYKYGELGVVESQYIKVLSNALKNFDNMKYDVNPAKEIMFKYLKNNKFLDDDSDIKDYGFNCYKETLHFKLKDKKLHDNTYLFNTETGDVYFINKILLKHINFDKYNNYNKVITEGIKSAYIVVSDIEASLLLRNISMKNIFS